MVDVTVTAALALFTVCPGVKVPAGDGLKFVSPLYTAVTLCGLPVVDNALIVNVQLPPTFATGACTEPSIVNVTVPVGTPAPGAAAVTVAVNVTACPNTDGLLEDDSDVCVSALLTVTRMVLPAA